MKVSLNWIKKFTSVNLPVDELVAKIGEQLGAVEEVINLGDRYKHIYAVKVVECAKHPNADKLHVCLIDDGGAVKDAARKNGLVEVVCGAPNVKAGLTVAWIPPGATVPATIDKDPFVLSAKELRGVVSNGMLASASELALGDDHDGLIILDDKLKAGTPLAEALELNDYVIDIENKMFTHRPDLFGILGVAREVAGIQNKPFKSPDWYKENADILSDGRKNVLKLGVKNQLPKLVPRFCAVAIKDVKVTQSPAWLKARLASVGIRPINNIVDVTNFLMHETAQPLHAYDYDKVKSGILGTRLSKKGEELKLLNGKTLKLNDGAVVITDGSRPIGLAGIMGGADTEVDADTTSIILEVASFDMNQTRKAAMEYGLFTDASTRFTKNQSPRQNRTVIVKAIEAVKALAGGRVASKIIDDNHAVKAKGGVSVTAEFVSQRLGENLPASLIKKLLENVEFKVEVSGQSLKVEVPFWRTDIEIAEDIVEEVGRLYGYDHLPQVLPKKDLAPASPDVPVSFKTDLRNILIRAGANEVLTYSFVPGSLLEKAGQDPEEAYHIKNALSPELQYYRLNLVPSLLEKVHPNSKNGYDYFALFEIGLGHIKDFVDKDKLPIEDEYLGLVVVNPYAKGAPYYQARTMADYVFSELNIPGISYQPLSEAKLKLKTSLLNCYEPARSAVVWCDGKPVGFIGEPSQKLRQSLKLPAATSVFELSIPKLYDFSQPKTYSPIGRFPSSNQDVCLRMPVKIAYGEADSFVWGQLDKLSKAGGYRYEMSTLDIFQKPGDKTHQQITWRIILSHPERTLTTDEVNKLLDKLSAEAKQKLQAERI